MEQPHYETRFEYVGPYGCPLEAQTEKRSIGRPQKGWIDDDKKMAGRRWMKD